MATRTTTTPKPETPQTFHPFPHLPTELRDKIWSLALLSPLTSTPTQPPPLKIIPFTPSHSDPSSSAHLGDIDTHIVPQHGPDWRSHPFAYRLEAEGKLKRDLALAKVRAARVHLLPNKERGAGPGVGRYDAGWAIRKEVEGVAASCREAGRVLDRLVRRFGGPEGWVDIGEGGGVCCFWDVGRDNSDWHSAARAHGRMRLVPSLASDDALRLDEGKKDEEEGELCMVRGLDKVVPATVHCEVLAAVWSPTLCMEFRLPDDKLRPGCAQFKRDMADLLSRHPKLHTIYLLDPSIQPSGLRVPKGCVPKFRGDGASFYEIETYRPGDGWLAPKPQLNHLDVFGWAQKLNMLLYQAQPNSQPARRIHVKVLACVPDLITTGLDKFKKPAQLNEPLINWHEPIQPHMAAAIACWYALFVMGPIAGPAKPGDNLGIGNSLEWLRKLFL